MDHIENKKDFESFESALMLLQDSVMLFHPATNSNPEKKDRGYEKPSAAASP